MIMTIGERIKANRLKRGLTQKELADLLGISPVNISQLENGNRSPTYATLMKIAKALDVNMTELDGNLIAMWKIPGNPPPCFEAEDSRDDSTEDVKGKLLDLFGKLNEQGKEIALKTVEILTEIPFCTMPDELTPRKSEDSDRMGSFLMLRNPTNPPLPCLQCSRRREENARTKSAAPDNGEP